MQGFFVLVPTLMFAVFAAIVVAIATYRKTIDKNNHCMHHSTSSLTVNKRYQP